MNKSTFIPASMLAELFDGLVFNLEKMRIVLPNGQELNKARFDVLFGGHTFALDADNIRVTRSAWRAFTANAAFRPTILFK